MRKKRIDKRLPKPARRYSASDPTGIQAALWMRQVIGNHKRNEDDYLSIGTFHRIVSDIASTIAECEPIVYQFQDGRKHPLPDHRVSRSLAEPSTEMSAYNFRCTSAMRLLIRKNSYAEIIPSNGLEDFFLELPPDKWITNRLKDREYQGYFTQTGEELDPRKLLHFRGVGLGGFVGYDLFKDNLEVSVASNALEYANSYFEHGTNMDGFFSSDFPLPPSEKEAFDKKLEGLRGADKAHKKELFSGNLKWNPIGNTAVDAQLIESRNASVSDLARLFGVPEKVLLEGVNEDTFQAWLSMICRHLAVFEHEYSFKLLTKAERQAGLFVEHDLSPLRRSQGSAKVDEVVKVAGYGVLDVDEMRDSLNLPPLPDGAGRVRLVATNNLDSIGNLQPAPESPLATTQDQEPATPVADPKTDQAEQPTYSNPAVKAVLLDQIGRVLVRGRKAVTGAATVEKLNRAREREAQYAREVLPPYAALAGLDFDRLFTTVTDAFEDEISIEVIVDKLMEVK